MLIVRKIFIITLVLLAVVTLLAQSDAQITAANFRLEESEDGITLTLEGPVEIIYGGDVLTADSAIVNLSSELESLDEALQSAELTGNVTYTGPGGSSATAGRADYFAQERRVVLSGGPGFTRGSLSITAGSVEYGILSNHVNMSGGCTLTENFIRASADSADYNINDETGHFSGDVEIRYTYEDEIFGEYVEYIYLTSGALFFSIGESIAKTPEGPNASRTVIIAGDYTLSADAINFEGGNGGADGGGGDASVEASGNVIFDGADKYFSAEMVSFDNVEGVIRADGGDGKVEFSILGQDGTADSIEVNFQDHWSIRLLGGSVGGEISDSTGENDGDEEEQVDETE